MKSKKKPSPAHPKSKPTSKKPSRARGWASKKNSRKSSLWWKPLVKWSLFALFLCILALFILFGAVYIGLFGKLPEASDLKGLSNANASELLASDGSLLGKYFVENRSSIAFQDIPDVVIQALIATEDNRFFQHEGIDFYSIPRVVVKSILLGDQSSGGGSTISQQLVKNLYGRRDYGALSMPVNKLKENVIALKLEEVYNKEEIITLYLNTISFGENVYGIKAASQRFFSKLPNELSTPEAATLIGMLKANTTYNPRLYPEASLSRRNTVLALMVKEGFIAPEEFAKLSTQPLTLRYRKMEGSKAPAAYFHAFAERQINALLLEATARNGVAYDLYRDGLRITTTIHPRLQLYAEQAVQAHMKQLQAQFDKHWKGQKALDEAFIWQEAKRSERYKRMAQRGVAEAEIRKIFSTPTPLLRYTYEGYERVEMSPLDSVAYHQMVLQASFVAINPKSGALLAYVGGIDHSHFPYDHVRNSRQVGSTFKPFVYAAAIEAGFSPCDYIENERIIFSNFKDWSPENSNGQYGGYYSLRGGLARSVNTIAARLIAETGPEAVINIARNAGIQGDLPAVPSLALGVAELSLMDMVQGYAAFANGGKRNEPFYISRIETADGQVLFENKAGKSVHSINEHTALSTLHMLQTVVDSGTARSLRSTYGLKLPLAGKTGTTQNNADGWFIAATPGLVCGTWVGGESPKVRFRSTALGQGAATALPIVGSFLQKASNDRQTSALLGTQFPNISAAILLDSHCPLYIESKSERLFDSLFDKDTRLEKKELREQVREERRRDQDASGGEEKDSREGWMKRLLNKLKKEEK